MPSFSNDSVSYCVARQTTFYLSAYLYNCMFGRKKVIKVVLAAKVGQFSAFIMRTTLITANLIKTVPESRLCMSTAALAAQTNITGTGHLLHPPPFQKHRLIPGNKNPHWGHVTSARQ